MLYAVLGISQSISTFFLCVYMDPNLVSPKWQFYSGVLVLTFFHTLHREICIMMGFWISSMHLCHSSTQLWVILTILQDITLNSCFSQWVALSVFLERISTVGFFLSIRLAGCLSIYISDIDNQLPGKPSFKSCQSNITINPFTVSMRMRMWFFTRR